MKLLFPRVILSALLFALIAGCDEPKIEKIAGTSEETATEGETSVETEAVADEETPAEVQPATLSEQELADGWILLFDGHSLFGWTAASECDWKVVDGAITATEGEAGLLHTTSQFGNYVLKLEFRSVKGGNSGVFLRTDAEAADVKTTCYELNIADTGTNDYPTGSLVQRVKCETQQDSEDWQSFEVTADGPRMVVKVDGKQVVDYTDPEPIGRGYIGLQFRIGKIQFRNIKLKPLGGKSLFNGKDLSGWKEYPDMDSTFAVDDKGWMTVKGGSGQLETEGQYGDFTLQLQSQTNAEGLNSGIFYRCIPGDKMNGYECQIENTFKDGDRNKPANCGTGGIFRRQDARRVPADDLKPFYLTIHADGPHVATWVDGYQVADWTDTREPDPNPRRGLRLDPGTIIIQGHDPTTDLLFRGFNLAELPPR